MMKNKKAIALAVSAMSVAGSVVPTFAAESRAYQPDAGENEDVNVAKRTLDFNILNNRKVAYIEVSNEDELETSLKELGLDSKNPKVVQENKTDNVVKGYFVEYDYNYGDEEVNAEKLKKDTIIEIFNNIQKETYEGGKRYKIYKLEPTKYTYDSGVKLKETTIQVVDMIDDSITEYCFKGEFNLDDLGIEVDSNIKEITLTASINTESDEFKELSKEIYKLEQRIKDNNYTIKAKALESNLVVEVCKSDKVTLVERITIQNLRTEETFKNINKLKEYLVGEEVIETISLTDISGHWAEDEILDAVLDGYVNGYLDGTFLPEETITRAEFAKVVCKAFDLKKDEDAKTTKYKDVKEDEWYAEYVLILDSLKIVNGYEDKTFRPNQTITRQEAAVILASIVNGDKDGNGKLEAGEKAKRVDTTSTNADGKTVHMDIKTQFDDDAQIDAWADEAVQFLADKKIVQGYQNKFNPANSIKRAEAVTMVMNAK